MAKTINREEFRAGVAVCCSVLHLANDGIVSRDTEKVVNEMLAIWTAGLESYLFDGIPPSADPEGLKA